MKLSIILFATLLTISTAVIAGEVSHISQNQLISLQEAKSAPTFVVLDVRSLEEFNEAHIKGAINISHKNIENNLAKLQSFKNELVIVHCRSGRRASIAEQVLINSGFNKVRHLTGDMNAWQESNLPVVESK